MVPSQDFPRNPPKPMKNKGKLSKTNVFPLFSLILTKNHEMSTSDERKKNHRKTSDEKKKFKTQTTLPKTNS